MRTSIDKQYIESRIKDVDYLVMKDGRTTICTITMANGYTVNGYSACVDIKNFDEALGRKYGYENAFEKLWPLEGYLLAERLHREERGDTNSYQAEQLKWHAALKCELMDILKISDPSNIVTHVRNLAKDACVL